MPMKYRRQAGGAVFDAANCLLMCFLMVLFIFPFWDTLILSLSTPVNASRLGLRLLALPPTLGAYVNIFRNDIILIGYANTLFRTLAGTLLTVTVTYLGAYALSKKQLPLRTPITALIVFTMFFSGGLVASYLNIKSLGLMGSRWVLILPGATGAWSLVVARNFIMSLPQELEDAAFVDGAHPLTMIFYIMLPLSAPILSVLALWSAVGHWNAWFDALIYISDRNKMVLQLVLRKILIESSDEVMQNMTMTTYVTTPETIKAAVIIVSVVPIIMVYPFLQKYFVKGLLIGSLKG
jgi:putative aldouronate transport system permease protein